MNIEEALDWAGKVSNGCSEAEHRLWYDCIMKVPDTEGGVAIELGAWRGGGSTILAAACHERGFTLLSADLWREASPTVDEHVQQLQAAGLDDVVLRMRGDSLRIGELLGSFPVIFVLIDASHRAEQTFAEFVCYTSLAVPGAYVCFHDAQEAGVNEAIEKLKMGNWFQGWTELKLPALGSPVTWAEGSTIDHKGPWWTRAWRRN